MTAQKPPQMAIMSEGQREHTQGERSPPHVSGGFFMTETDNFRYDEQSPRDTNRPNQLGDRAL